MTVSKKFEIYRLKQPITEHPTSHLEKVLVKDYKNCRIEPQD